MIDIVIEVRGGVVQAVFTNKSDIRVSLIDWDEGEDVASLPLFFPTDPMHTMSSETADLLLASKSSNI